MKKYIKTLLAFFACKNKKATNYNNLVYLYLINQENTYETHAEFAAVEFINETSCKFLSGLLEGETVQLNFMSFEVNSYLGVIFTPSALKSKIAPLVINKMKEKLTERLTNTQNEEDAMFINAKIQSLESSLSYIKSTTI